MGIIEGFLKVSVLAHPSTGTLVFATQRYAKRSIFRRHASVCVLVCHTPVLYQNS